MLQIHFKTDKSDKTSMAYYQVAAKSWSVTSNLLCVETDNGVLSYFPLINIEVFKEVKNDRSSENREN